MELIIDKLSKDSGKSSFTIRTMINEISASLIYEGCSKDDPRFMQYLIRRVRKRLQIEESQTFQSFKQFFQR